MEQHDGTGGTKELLPGSCPRAAGTPGAPRGPVLLQTSPTARGRLGSHPSPLPVRSGGQAGSPGTALTSKPFASRFPLGLARVSHRGRQTESEWGKNYRVCLNCLVLRTLSRVLSFLNSFSRGLCGLHDPPPWHAHFQCLRLRSWHNFGFL